LICEISSKGTDLVKTTGKEDPVELDFSYFVKEVVWRRIKGSCNKNEIPLKKFL